MEHYRREVNLRCLAWRKRNRGHFEIIASMLEAVKYNGASRYSLSKHIGCSYVELKKYLESLNEMGFIETDINDGRVLYRASEKGLEFLRRYHALLGMMLNTSTCGTIVLPKLVEVHES